MKKQNEARWRDHRAKSLARIEDGSIPEPNTGCWLWLGRCDPKGYGCMGYMGEVRAHRASWVLHNGPIPAGMFVCHRCDVPACVNPAHLFIGSYLDNVRDRNSKGRTARGSRVGGAKLTADDVARIHAERAKGRGSFVLAREFGINESHVRRIFNRVNWRDS